MNINTNTNITMTLPMPPPQQPSTTSLSTPSPTPLSLARPPASRGAPLGPQLLFRNYTLFRHPGYPDTDNILFHLPPIDSGGIHHGTALTICQILSSCALGYLVPARDVPRIQQQFDDILREPEYYFYDDPASPLEHPYPVYPSFEDWVFPRPAGLLIPSQWYEAFTSVDADVVPLAGSAGPSRMSTAVTTRDGTCRLSGTGDICQNAHLVPIAQLPWFVRNHMNLFGSNPALSRADSIHDVRNGILLRADLHFALDMHKLTFCVKEGKVLAHFLQPTTDLGCEFHNVELRPVVDAAPEYFFARFAMTVIPLVRNFAGAPGRRVLRAGVLGEVAVEPRVRGGGKKRRLPEADVELEDRSGATVEGRWHERVLAEAHDSEDEDREDSELAATVFPGVFDGLEGGSVCRSVAARHVVENINFYPRLRKMRRLKANWMKEHPNVWTVRGE